MRSFRVRILALVLGIVTLVVTATIVAVVAKARAEVGRQTALQLRSAAATAREVLKFRGNQLTSAVEVLTSDFGFKEAIASGDTPTLMSAISNHRARLGADLLIVLNAEGRPVASSLATLSTVTQNDLQGLVTGDVDARPLRLYRLIDGRPYQLVIAPVLAPDPIAWAAMGFALDDKVAADLARLLGVEVSFVTGELPAHGFVASSLALTQRDELDLLTTRTASTPFSIRTQADEFLTWTNPIRSANGPLTLVLQQSLASAERPYLQLRGSILTIGLVILALACALAALLARSATRPVEDLTHAAERLEAGDYVTPVPAAATTEISRLSRAFNAMRTAVAERERIIRHQADHDPLTGLPTRTRMTELIDALLAPAAAPGSSFSVCLIEIVQFHNIVGSFGHAAADGVLREVARRLSLGNSMRERVARIGTDQFLVVLDGSPGQEPVDAGQRLAEQLRVPFDYAGASLQLETRIGISVFPNDGQCAADLLQRADLALYRASESGFPVSAFVPGDDELQRHRLAIVGDLRRALAADELELYYQPKVSVPAGGVIGCETLVRWRHSQKGFIPPSEFIAHAERTGLIRVLTTWVLRNAFRQLRRWQQMGLTLDVSVNVSPVDLADSAFAESVIALIRETAVDASQVVLEVTESGAMRDLPKTLQIMQELRVLGIRFSIDDFGTGYSSLAHLRRLPVDEIKIDRSFVQELETGKADDVILRSTINLGHALNLKVVAEGVEMGAGWAALERLGCDLIQGYYVAKPLPAGDFIVWVGARTAQSGRPPATQAGAAEPIAPAQDRRAAGG